MKTKTEILEYLNGFNADSFRTTTNKQDDSYIYDAQIDAAKQVVSELASNTTRTNHVILIAKMQSGKTGTCNAIANIVMNTDLQKKMLVKKILFISGMNDCGLASQTYERAIKQIAKANSNNTFDGTKQSKNIKRPKFYVLKNSNLKKFQDSLNHCLIFIDEAHFGSKERNVLTKFMLSKGIDWKNQKSLFTNNIYIVSVSATPFDEIISDTIDTKPIIELKTDDSYIGVSQYIEKGLIHDVTKDDIKNGNVFNYIQDAYERMNDNSEKGVVIVRTREFADFYANAFVMNNFRIHEMYANGSKIEYDRLNTILNEMVEINNSNNQLFYRSHRDSRVTAEPQEIKPLLVLIKGAFRAGITLSTLAKDLIYMVYDYSAGADTTAQALLGRMCGYRDLEHTVFNTHFYLNSKFAQMYSDWENNFTNKELIPCNRTKWVWLDNTYQGNDVKLGTKSCGNFTIELSQDDADMIWQKCANTHSQKESTKEILPHIFRKYNKEIPYDYLIEAYMSGKNNYAKSVQEKRFDSFNNESLVFQFEPNRMPEFKEQTGRSCLIKEDIGKKGIGIVFDATVEYISSLGRFVIGGNRRLLVYYVEVGQKKRMANHQSQYQAHKDTALVH